MGQASVRTNTNPVSDAQMAFRVIDVIQIDPRFELGVSGYVLVLEDFRHSEPTTLIGQSVEIFLREGWTLTGEIAGVRHHGTTISILLKNWPDEFPRPSIDWRVAIRSSVFQTTT